MNQRKMDKLQNPQQAKEIKPDPEKYEVGDLIQVRNMAPSDKLSSHWEKVFVITRVASNAIRCVRWQIDLHPPYKLRQEPKNMGQIEEHLVHPKDVKKWNSDLPPSHVWDEKLVETLLQSCESQCQIRPDGESAVNAEDISVGGASIPPPAPPTPPRPAPPPVPPGHPSPPAPHRPDPPQPPPPVPRPTPPVDDGRYRFPPREMTSVETIPDTDLVTLDDNDSLVDHYQLAGQATELLQKTAEGRRVLTAFNSNTRRFEKLFDAFLEARNQPRVTLGPPPRPTTIQDRLEKLIPGPRAQPLQTAQLSHILNKDINTELDIAGCDGERLQEYERTYINVLSFPQLPNNSRESNNSQCQTSRVSMISHSPGARPMH